MSQGCYIAFKYSSITGQEDLHNGTFIFGGLESGSFELREQIAIVSSWIMVKNKGF
jgi:hypothetical protein